jgi:hypothetical protein
MRKLSVLVALLFVGCAYFRGPAKPSIAGAPGAEVQFCGIERALTANKSARVLIMHGMGWHESHDYDAAFRDSLRESLKMEPLGCAGPYPIVNQADPLNNYGSLLRCTYRRASDDATVRVYNLLWSPLTMPYKVGALAYDYDRPYHAQRARVNRALKKQLIDRAFSDAVLYAGKLHQAIGYTVRQAICAAATDQLDLTRPCGPRPALTADPIATESELFIITHSLGSAMLLETLGEAASDSEAQAQAIQDLVKHVRLIAMMANQLPLIRLSQMTQPPADAPMVNQAPPRTAFSARTTPIPVAAFTDINDLLSYLPEMWKHVLYPGWENFFTFVNFPVVNARSATGFLANPGTAHTGYWTNRVIMNAITHGYRCQ